MTDWGTHERRLRRTLARNVLDLRTKRGLTVEEVAHTASMHWRHWQKVEAAEVSPTLRTMVKLAISLGVEPAELLR